MTERIIFVSHCVMNTASKVVRTVETKDTKEDKLRREFLHYAIDHDIQLVQLPCPEFMAYGASRWGHTMEQFDNPFFREHCRKLLLPVLLQMKAYMQPRESSKFEVLGIVGINGSPSCGVSFTCSGPWGGELSGRTDLEETLSKIQCAPKKGVMMDVLAKMMEEEGIQLKMVGLDSGNPKPLYELLEDSDR